VGILLVATCIALLMLLAVLKDDLIQSFQQQLSDRDQQVESLTAELNSCYARLSESDALLERCRALCWFFFFDDNLPSQRVLIFATKCQAGSRSRTDGCSVVP
jgi:hypothetical protein